MACDALHRRATRSWPKALGNRLYGSLSTLLGITPSDKVARHRSAEVNRHLRALLGGDTSGSS
ncbi:MAG: hypothetical protein IIA68_06805 [Proteobacteria bacterium]|nr:hypothetical protein [Pseudomonadota bacterium]